MGATIATMLNITRYSNAVASASLMNLGSQLAEDYARRRIAFGKPIAEHPLHAVTLAAQRKLANGALSLCMEVAELLGRAEAGTSSETERRILRALVPIAKLLTGKQAVAHASETLECFGGAGYVEDTGRPRLLRDARVLPIWEGTTNVLSLDVLRAERKEQALTALWQHMRGRGADSAAIQALDPSREENARHVCMETGRLMQELLLRSSQCSEPRSCTPEHYIAG